MVFLYLILSFLYFSFFYYICNKNINYSLHVALDKMTAIVGATVTVDGSFRIELLETLLIGDGSTVTPDLFALQIKSWTHPVETTSVVGTRAAVFLIEIRRALAVKTGACFR